MYADWAWGRTGEGPESRTTQGAWPEHREGGGPELRGDGGVSCWEMGIRLAAWT